MLTDSAESTLPIAALIQACEARWWASPTTPPDLGQRYSAAEQAAGEARLARLAESFSDNLRQPLPNMAAQRILQ